MVSSASVRRRRQHPEVRHKWLVLCLLKISISFFRILRCHHAGAWRQPESEILYKGNVFFRESTTFPLPIFAPPPAQRLSTLRFTSKILSTTDKNRQLCQNKPSSPRYKSERISREIKNKIEYIVACVGEWNRNRSTSLNPSVLSPLHLRKPFSPMDKKTLEFVTYCIRKLSRCIRKLSRLFNLPQREVYRRLNSSGILYDYIVLSYDVLHTFSSQYLKEDLTGYMKEKGVLE